MPLSHDAVDEILRLIDGAGGEVHIEDGDFTLIVRRGDGTRRLATTAAGPESAAPPKGSADRGAATGPAGTPQPEAHSVAEGEGTVVAATMTGTFYTAPSPHDPPFVELGAQVEAGDPLGLIEVMKLYTTVEAPCAGRVVAIAVENAAVVETGAPLFRIEPV